MPEGPTARGANHKYKLFAAKYLIDYNATNAAIAAGYSPKTAYSAGHRLLKRVEVQEILNKKIAVRVEKFDINADLVLNNLAEIACMRMAPSKHRPADKIKANELLGKHLNLWHESDSGSRNSFTVVFTDVERQKAIDTITIMQKGNEDGRNDV